MRSDPQQRAVPVLEVGGSHVTAAAVDLGRDGPDSGDPDGGDPDGGHVVPGSRCRSPLDPHADAATLLAAMAVTANRLTAGTPGLADAATWGVAVPGPFDYQAGVAHYHGVGKFAALDRVDVGAELTGRIRPAPSGLRFLNDASAFGLGAWWRAPAPVRRGRLVAVTLGTGVGSAFLDAGTVVEDDPRVPPEGRADLLTIDGRPLEDTVSTRALIARYAALTGTRVGGVRELVELSGTDPTAGEVITGAMRKLGTAIAPWLVAFGAELVVFGGSVTAAWPLIGPPLLAGIAGHDATLTDRLDVTVTADSEDIALLGAAVHAARSKR